MTYTPQSSSELPLLTNEESVQHLLCLTSAMAQGHPFTQLNADGSKITHFGYRLPTDEVCMAPGLVYETKSEGDKIQTLYEVLVALGTSARV